MNLHLSTLHGINESDCSKNHKVIEYFQVYRSSDSASSSNNTALTEHEFNRDLVLWLCHDLLPFKVVKKEGKQIFSRKIACLLLFHNLQHFPQLH